MKLPATRSIRILPIRAAAFGAACLIALAITPWRLKAGTASTTFHAIIGTVQ
jgi:hypothetical protein